MNYQRDMRRNKIAIVLALIAILLATTALISRADLVWFYADQYGPLTRSEPPTTEGETVFLPSPGNSHAVIHGKRVKAEGRSVCTGCHNGTSAIVKSDKFICSQYDFFKDGRKVSDGKGGYVKDPVSGQEIVSGGGIAVLLTGEPITCKMCHYPHKTAGFKAEDYLVHEGCLDCHTKVGSGDIAGNSTDEDEGDSDSIGFVKEPYQRLCDDCHKYKTWRSESHKKHKEERVTCTKCHTM